MESFTLTCTTCKSRLKVRDTGVIGQIMACPKCGGMVLLKPPEPSAPGKIPAANDTGETKPDLSHPLRTLPPLNPAAPLKADAFDDIDVLLGDAPARIMVPSPTVRHSATSPPAPTHPAPPLPPPKGASPATTQAFIRPNDQQQSPDSQAQTLSQNDIPAPAKPVKGTPPVKQADRAAAAAAAVASVPLPSTTAAPAAANPAPAPIQPVLPAVAPAPGTLAGSPWQYWVMVSASGLLGILLAVGVVAVTISWFNNGQQPLAPPVAHNTNPATPENSNPAVEAVASVPTPPAEPQEPVVPPPLPVPMTDPVTLPPAQPVVPPNPLPPNPLPPNPLPLNPLPAQPMPPAERDPLGLTDPPPTQPALSADDPFKKFGAILGGPSDPMPPAQPAAAPPVIPPPEDEANVSPTTKLPKPQPRHIDVAARLAEPLPAIDIANAPLIDLLQLMQGISTVPITLRPDGLAMVHITPYSAETPVSWKGSSTTVLDAIQGALQPLGLEAKVEADQLIVDVASQPLITTKLAVQDLTGSDDRRATDLAALLMTFVAPDSWSDEEGQPTLAASKDELTVRQNRSSLAECVVLVEKLRVARGLRPLSKFDSKLFELKTRSERAAAALNAPLTLNYSIPTPLARVTDRLGKEAKVRILFDWQSMSASGWNPDTEVTLTVEKQPLSAALNDLTQRMDLTWRAVDARTIQILSPQTQSDRTELELYSVRDLATDEAAAAGLIAKIRNTLGGQAFRDAGGRGEVRFDAAGKCLIAALSQPQQQQVAALLKSLRTP